MPPPIYRLLQIITTKITVPARVCNVKDKGRSPWFEFNRGRGHCKVALPIGRYEIREVWRDMRYYHEIEYSDGYTYRLQAEDKDNPLYGKRISIWQNDLYDAVEGIEECENEDE